MKSNKEMSAMVQLLERLRDAMPRVNFFGESNVNRTNAQIDGITTEDRWMMTRMTTILGRRIYEMSTM